jgi:hypothetical protein
VHRKDAYYQQPIMPLATGEASIWNKALSEKGTQQLVFAAEHFKSAAKLTNKEEWRW